MCLGFSHVRACVCVCATAVVMMEDDDTRGKKEDPIVVQSLADFKYNCELLEGSLGNGTGAYRLRLACGAGFLMCGRCVALCGRGYRFRCRDQQARDMDQVDH